MIREIIAAQLPVGEKLRIVKNRIEGKDPDSGRIAIVSGIHGDEFEGQYVICLLYTSPSPRDCS